MNIVSLIKSLPGACSQGLIWGLLGIGVYITFRVLDYSDMTVDGSMATGAAVAVMAMLGGMNPYLALLLALIAGMATGLITGFLHTVLGIPAILSGILTQIGLYSINMRILGKSNQAISVDKYDLIVSLRYIPSAIIVSLLFCIVIIAILYWFFGTEVGHSIRATGNNPNMARAQGINTNLNKVMGLTISNGLVALSGALYAQYQGSADVNMGRGAIVIGLAAIIMSEVIFGRIFHNFALKLFAVVLGSILYFMIISLVLQLGLSTTDLKLFSAIVVATFLAFPYLKKIIAEKRVRRTN